MKRSTVPVALTLSLLMLTGFLQLKLSVNAAPTSGHFNTAVQLSDHIATGNDATLNRQWSVIGHESAHIFWLENTDS